MENARVAIFEDREYITRLLRIRLEESSNQVVAEISSIDEARDFIGAADPESLDVALVDGNLLGSDKSGQHGAEISSLIRRNLPGVTVIGISGESAIEGAHISFIKPDLEGVVDAIRALPSRKFSGGGR